MALLAAILMMKNLKFVLPIMAISSCLLLQNVQAAPGDIDYSFSPTGSFGDYTDDTHGFRGVVLQADGKKVCVGKGRAFAGGTSDNPVFKDGFLVFRSNSNGGADTQFNPTSTFGYIPGANNVDFGDTSSTANAVALQSNGRIVAVGTANGNFAIARLNINGSLDTSFAGTGKISLNMGNNDIATSVKIQSDGKIVVGGYSTYVNTNGRFVSDFVLVRYNTNGTLDSTFDTDGKVRTLVNLPSGKPANARLSGISIQPDGKIIAAGSFFDSIVNLSSGDFAAIRYNTNGSVDTTFGTNGSAIIDMGGNDACSSTALQADGKIVIVGTSASRFALTRLTTQGIVDTYFGTSGKVLTSFPSTNRNSATATAYAAAIQSDGKIVVVGEGPSKYELGSYPNARSGALARYNSNGSLDTTFYNSIYPSDQGRFVDSNTVSGISYYYAVSIQPDGRIIAAGHTDSLGSECYVLRYTGNSTSTASSLESSAPTS